MKPTPQFHPNAPKRLVKLWHKHPAYYKIATELQVNRGTVWLALRHGKEPVKEETRVKFGLPKKPRKTTAGKVRIYKPAHIKWWNRLDASMRNMYIEETYKNWANQ